MKTVDRCLSVAVSCSVLVGTVSISGSITHLPQGASDIAVLRLEVLHPEGGYWKPTRTLTFGEPARFLVYYRTPGRNPAQAGATIWISHNGKTVAAYRGRMEQGTSAEGVPYFRYAVSGFQAQFLKSVPDSRFEPIVVQYKVYLGGQVKAATLRISARGAIPPPPGTPTPTPTPWQGIGPPPTATPIATPVPVQVVVDALTIENAPKGRAVTITQLRRTTFIARYHIVHAPVSSNDVSLAVLKFRDSAGKTFPFKTRAGWKTRDYMHEDWERGIAYFTTDASFIVRIVRRIDAQCTVTFGRSTGTRTLPLTIKPR